MRVLKWILIVAVAAVIARSVTIFLLRPRVPNGSALSIELSGTYVEAAEPPLLARLLGLEQHSLLSVLSELHRAARDARIQTVLIRVEELDVGWAKAQELRDAIAELRKAGKRTITYLAVESFGANIEYYLAASAEKVYVAPGAEPPLVGLAAQYLYLGGLWEKLGVQVEVERVGEYKTAADQLAGTHMSDPGREMANWLLDSLDEQFVSGIAQSRGIATRDVRDAIAAAPVQPNALVKLRLADGVESVQQVLHGIGDPPVVDGDDYARVGDDDVGIHPVATFAIVYGTGEVVMGRESMSHSGRPVLAAETVSDALDQAAGDSSVRAILLRIDSPGGSALASDIVWQAVRRAREKKPVIASFSDVAASGGYYVACGADEVVADPGTITGSIGVLALRPVLAGLFDKLGVGYAGLTRGPHADLLLSTRELSSGSREILHRSVEDAYQRFVSRVAKGRGLQPQAVDAVGRGRVWTGGQAAKHGLVTALGGLRTATARAKAKLDLPADAEVSFVLYPQPRSLVERIRGVVQGAAVRASTALAPLPPVARRLVAWVQDVPFDRPVFVPPVAIDVR